MAISPPYPIFIDDDTDLKTFDLQDIREVRGEDMFVDEGKEMKALVLRAAAALEQSGPRLLSGDFSEFDGAWEIVKARAKKFRQQG